MTGMGGLQHEPFEKPTNVEEISVAVQEKLAEELLAAKVEQSVVSQVLGIVEKVLPVILSAVGKA